MDQWIKYFTTTTLLLSTVNNWHRQLPGYYQNQDTTRNIYELIESRGFRPERHYIQTPDGYILQLVRIVNPFKNKTNLGRPILLHHGFQCSGTFWLITTNGTLDRYGNYLEFIEEEWNLSNGRPEIQRKIINGTEEIANTLAYVLSSRGYDVWLANYRGSLYSTNHSWLNVRSVDFWKFSMDEMIHVDLPVQMDYILEQTKHSSLGYIGHSQGSFMMLALMSTTDKYNDKVQPFIALSPVFFATEIPPALQYLTQLRQILRNFPTLVPFTSDETRLQMADICQNVFLRGLCFFSSYPIFGTQMQNLIQYRIPVYMSAVPMGSSSWNAAHLFQLFDKKQEVNHVTPSYFDYGPYYNRKIYGQTSVPIYDASKINSTHIALFYSRNDWLNHLKSVHLLKTTLKVKLLDDYLVADSTYTHFDMVWAKHTGQMVNKRVLKLLAIYD